MIYIKPSFFNEFKCIASQCTDNCCIGWEIDVDETALNKYKSITGDLGSKIKKNLVTSEDGSICFKLCSDERCPFLNKGNLCEIISECGEDYLCDICREHPRFYEWFAGVTECGLGLSCEEACRLLFQKGFYLTEENDGEKVDLSSKEDIVESDTYIYLSAFRERLFDVLKKESLSHEEKIVKILTKAQDFTGEECKIKNKDNLIKEYLKTEPIDNEWTKYIDFLEESKASLTGDVDLNPDFNKIYSDLLSYIIYRHLIKAVFDGEIAKRVSFCVDSLRFIMLCNEQTVQQKGDLSLTDFINNVKRWSKQIEYSEVNTDFLIFGE